MSHLDDSSLCVNKLRRMFIFTPLNMENIQLEQWTFALKLVILERREMGESGGKTAPHGCLPPEGPTAAPPALLSGNGEITLCWGCPQDSLGLPGWANLTFLRHIQKIRHSIPGMSWKHQVKAAVPLPKVSHTPLQKIFQFLYGRSHYYEQQLRASVSENACRNLAGQKANFNISHHL